MTFMRGVAELAPGDHVCLVYDDERRRDELLLSFLDAGVQRGERVIYLADGADTRIGPQLAAAAAPGQVTVVPSWDEYVCGDTLDFARAYDAWQAAVAETQAQGFPVLRAAGEPPEIATRNGHRHELCDYERRANELFADKNFVAICVYDTRKTHPAALLGVLDAHPIVLFALQPSSRLRVEKSGVASLALSGWLDVTTLGSLVDALGVAVGGGSDVVVDLAGLDFVDIAGLRLFVEAARRLHERKRTLLLKAAPDWVPSVLGILGYAHREGLVLQ